MVKHSAPIVVHCLVLFYFFRGNVLAFFGLSELSKLKAIGILVGVALAILALSSAIMLLAG